MTNVIDLPYRRIPVPEDRERILNRTRDALESAGTRLLLAGEPGIGKSFLLDVALGESAAAASVNISYANQFGQRPFQTMKELLVDTPPEVVQTMPEPQQDAYRAAIGESSASTPGTSSLNLAAAIGHVLTGFASYRKTLVVENWQWVDQESLRLLSEVFRRPSVRQSVSIVATMRDSFLGDDHLPTVLFDRQDIVTVPPVRPRDLQDVVHRQLDLELTPTELARIVDLSRGNPLWAFELGMHSGEQATLETVPPRILVDIRDHLESQSPSVVRLLRVVSALGRVRLSDSARFLPDGAEGLSAAIAAGVVLLDKAWIRPAHPLLAQASLQLLDPKDRLHLFTGLSDLPLPLPQRVAIRDAATTSGVDESLAHDLSSAASDERRIGALAPAVHLARRALTRTTVDSLHFNERQLRAASYSLAADDVDSTIDDLTDLDLTGMAEGTFDRVADLLAEALYRKGGGALVRERFGPLLLASSVPQALRDIVSVYLITFARGRTGEDLSELRAIDARLSELTAPRAKAAAKRALLEIRVDMGEGFDEDALGFLRRIETRSAPTTTERSADAVEGFLGYQVDDLERSRAALNTVRLSARTSGENYALVQAVAHSTIVETLSGHLPRAEALLRGIADSEAALGQHLPASVYRAKAFLALAQDDENNLRDIASTAFSPGGEDRGELLRKSVLGLLAAQRGDPVTAVELLTSAVHTAELRGITEPGRRMWIDIELVRALIRIGAHDRIPSALARVEQAARNSRRLHATGQVDRLNALVLASTGDTKAGLTLIDRGVSRITSSGFRLEAVRALLDQTGMLFAAGNSSGAREALRKAEKINDDAQSEGLRNAISTMQEDHQTANDLGVLTASEQKVAELVAAGLSNKSVADTLHLSVRTVETHLSSAYRKTGIRSRTQLVLWVNS